jgi:hypothetical protein
MMDFIQMYSWTAGPSKAQTKPADYQGVLENSFIADGTTFQTQ